MSLFATRYATRIRPAVDRELAHAARAERDRRPQLAFAALERAHVLGQASTMQHVRVHVRMLRWGVRHRVPREVLGQLLRIVGAATKTAFGWVPPGNTGGSNVSPFRSMPIPPELRRTIEAARAPRAHRARRPDR